MNTAQHLRASAAVMRERGMMKLSLIDNVSPPGKESVCALGAMGVAALEEHGTKVKYHIFASRDISQAVRNHCRSSVAAMAAVIREQYPDFVKRQPHWAGTGAEDALVAAWNNDEERTQAEVEAVFEKAAVQAEEKELLQV